MIKSGNKIGMVIEVDFHSNRGVWVTNYIRVKILLQTSHPLRPGFFLPRDNMNDTWIQFKYEKISRFCFNCGRLEHMTSICLAPLNDLAEPASFSYCMMANNQDKHRFIGPNRVIPKPTAAHQQQQQFFDHFHRSNSNIPNQGQGIFTSNLRSVHPGNPSANATSSL